MPVCPLNLGGSIGSIARIRVGLIAGGAAVAAAEEAGKAAPSAQYQHGQQDQDDLAHATAAAGGAAAGGTLRLGPGGKCGRGAALLAALALLRAMHRDGGPHAAACWALGALGMG